MFFMVNPYSENLERNMEGVLKGKKVSAVVLPLYII